MTAVLFAMFVGLLLGMMLLGKGVTTVVWDLETTGLSKSEDRIVQFGAVRYNADGSVQELRCNAARCCISCNKHEFSKQRFTAEQYFDFDRAAFLYDHRQCGSMSKAVVGSIDVESSWVFVVDNALNVAVCNCRGFRCCAIATSTIACWCRV